MTPLFKKIMLYQIDATPYFKVLTLGPIELIPCSLHISTKTAFSARKPYP